MSLFNLGHSTTKNQPGEVNGYVGALAGFDGPIPLSVVAIPENGQVLTYNASTEQMEWQDPPTTGGAASSLNYNNSAGQISVNGTFGGNPLAGECLVADGPTTASWRFCPGATGLVKPAGIGVDLVTIGTTVPAVGKVLKVTSGTGPYVADWSDGTSQTLPLPGAANTVLASDGPDPAVPTYRTLAAILSTASSRGANNNTFFGSPSGPYAAFTFSNSLGGFFYYRSPVTNNASGNVSLLGDVALGGWVNYTNNGQPAPINSLTISAGADLDADIASFRNVTVFTGMSFNCIVTVNSGYSITTISAGSGTTYKGPANLPLDRALMFHFTKTGAGTWLVLGQLF